MRVDHIITITTEDSNLQWTCQAKKELGISIFLWKYFKVWGFLLYSSLQLGYAKHGYDQLWQFPYPGVRKSFIMPPPEYDNTDVKQCDLRDLTQLIQCQTGKINRIQKFNVWLNWPCQEQGFRFIPESKNSSGMQRSHMRDRFHLILRKTVPVAHKNNN